MLVSEVKEKYPLVYERVVEQVLKGADLANPTTTINRCLLWSNTKEGYKFWKHMEHRNINMAKSICPHLFGQEEDKSSYKVVTNGLFKN